MDPSEKNVFDFADDLLKHRAYQQALQIFEYGAGKYPRSTRLHVGLAVARYSLGDYAKAVQSLCDAVDLSPRDTKALDFLGKMYDVSPEMADEVTKRLARFAHLYPDSAPANYYYALSLRRRTLTGPQQSREAELLLKKAVQLDPKFADAHYQLGLLFEDQGENAKAIREYEIAAKLDGGSKSIHYRLARLYAKNGESDLSRREFEIVQRLEQAHR
jgi:tetratricopeptide (TPR) repeat protein